MDTDACIHNDTDEKYFILFRYKITSTLLTNIYDIQHFSHFSKHAHT